MQKGRGPTTSSFPWTECRPLWESLLDSLLGRGPRDLQRRRPATVDPEAQPGGNRHVVVVGVADGTVLELLRIGVAPAVLDIDHGSA